MQADMPMGRKRKMTRFALDAPECIAPSSELVIIFINQLKMLPFLISVLPLKNKK
jgi:hypothetical protein